MHVTAEPDGLRDLAGMARRSRRNACRRRSISRAATDCRTRIRMSSATGTNLVVGLDDELILKIFPPFLRGQFVSERMFAGAAARPARRPDSGNRARRRARSDGRICVITRLSGCSGRARRGPDLPEDQKERVLAEIGETIAASAARPGSAISLASSRAGTRFMRGQIAGCRDRHERLGLPQKFLDGLDDLLADAEGLVALDAAPVILTGEFIPENFLLSCDHGAWRLAGLIDFGDVMTGRGEYDLLGPSASDDRLDAAPGPKPVRGIRLFRLAGVSISR